MAKVKDMRWSKMDETMLISNETPASTKYDAIEMEKIRTKSPLPNFNERAVSQIGARFKNPPKDDKPGATSYEP